MLANLKNRFSRSAIPMSTSTPKATMRAKPKPKQKVVVKSVKVTPVPRVKKSSLVCAEGEQCFWTNDGKILSTLNDLKRALKDMSKDAYGHHTDGRNDFASWVEFVLLDTDCANELRKAKTQKEALAVVSKKLS